MIDVLDYGLGNFGSVIRMIEKAGGAARRISSPAEILRARKLILPGVGHFDHAMSRILENGLLEPLRERVVVGGVPILGICLGMQLMCSGSEEGRLPGLGFVNADVRRFPALASHNLKVPHMGWNSVEVIRDNPLFNITNEEQRFYFVHSYYVAPREPELSIAVATHGVGFCAAFQSNNIFGAQFHPEKSHRFGTALMKRFVEY